MLCAAVIPGDEATVAAIKRGGKGLDFKSPNDRGEDAERIIRDGIYASTGKRVAVFFADSPLINHKGSSIRTCVLVPKFLLQYDDEKIEDFYSVPDKKQEPVKHAEWRERWQSHRTW